MYLMLISESAFSIPVTFTPADISPFIKAILKPLMKMYKLAQGL